MFSWYKTKNELMKLNKAKIIQRIIKFMNSPLAGKYIPYAWGSKQILKFVKSDYSKKKHFRKRLNLFEEFLKNIEDPPKIEDIVPNFLISSFLKPWRSMAFSYFSKTNTEKYVTIHGLKKFQKSYNQGKGVIILNSHWGFAEAAITLFPMLAYPDFFTIVRMKGSDSLKFIGLKKEMQPQLIIFKNHSNAELFKSLFKAREALMNGHIFHILGDGYHGKSSININFLGRIRGFRASFAELGLSTDAAIHPIFIAINNDGTIDAHILDPIDKGDNNLSRQDRIKYMLEQYVSVLEQKWKEEPQHINQGFMEKYLRQVHQNLE